MVSIVRAVEGVEGIPAGFPILLDRDMAIVESAFRYLLISRLSLADRMPPIR